MTDDFVSSGHQGQEGYNTTLLQCATGRGFCVELAKQKSNLVIISRSEQKLMELKDQLENEFRVRNQIHP